MSRYDEGHKKKTRDRILRHAVECLGRDGKWPPPILEVMANAGLTHGAFYAHFRSRTDFIEAALDYAFKSAEKQWCDRLASVPHAQKLETLVRACLMSDEAGPAGVGPAAVALEPQGSLACARSRIAAHNRRMIELVALHLPAGGDRQKRADRAALVFASILGTRQLMRAEADSAEARRLAEAGLQGAMALANRPWNAA